MTKKAQQPKIADVEERTSMLERIAIGATNSIGSLPSLVFHSIFFVGIFSLQLFGFSFEEIMLILTTVVSLEAIYLSIFIQMSVNRQALQIAEVSEDIEEIQEDTKEISEDVEGIQEDIEEIQEDTKEISEDIEEIQEDTKEISEDVENIKENVEDLGEDFEKSEEGDGIEMAKIHQIERSLEELLREIKTIKMR
ncbi:MAG: hypothetical protein A2845_04620 [Candidatus Lloydbacteria bacterium RIFCSPHIGHO2_01_FULL_49_22]|uniref:Syntaxin N-terminal domain-containing protein n=1 Tax=Candidatus Lloydbacteria bacterium RIFCSPHIGHO2_01_FULL_49_22 TaxID=1798658 RepID=A0A1G2CWF2_9BACT|nr:MAG: hypothetical protein A2845_04620 [Candidatus Lloydbacteria bacterium RIFCSPHIGHO2_01_FULL_49_22]OGZ10167.1 MAG: hypothetical protein A3C14_00655 [Candidatus Lloydbacteria bacterium RIFCSPHIGHO2_02_FULL_50_18]